MVAGGTGHHGRKVTVQVKTNLYNYTGEYHGRGLILFGIWYLIVHTLTGSW